jgi:hypothetical protein
LLDRGQGGEDGQSLEWNTLCREAPGDRKGEGRGGLGKPMPRGGTEALQAREDENRQSRPTRRTRAAEDRVRLQKPILLVQRINSRGRTVRCLEKRVRVA